MPGALCFACNEVLVDYLEGQKELKGVLADYVDNKLIPLHEDCIACQSQGLSGERAALVVMHMFQNMKLSVETTFRDMCSVHRQQLSDARELMIQEGLIT